jgi:Cu-Zn family superoxide dismutase
MTAGCQNCKHCWLGKSSSQKMCCAPVKEAVCVLSPFGGSGVSGVLHFRKVGDKVRVTGEIHGLTPGKHGFHVHELGDVSDMQTGKSTGGHYNPTNMPHGRMTDAKRHVGDLGNVTANANGVAVVDKTDGVIALCGCHSIIGRAIIVHAGEDHFTQPTGDAGGRVAGGVIGIAKPTM